MFSRKACAWGKTKRFKSGYVSFFSPSSSTGLVFFYMLKYFNFFKKCFFGNCCAETIPINTSRHLLRLSVLIQVRFRYTISHKCMHLHSTAQGLKLRSFHKASSESRLISQSSHIHIAVLGGPIHHPRIKPHISIKVEVKSKTQEYLFIGIIFDNH